VRNQKVPPPLPEGACKLCGGSGAVATMLGRAGDAQEWATVVCSACSGSGKAKAAQPPADVVVSD
jgi:hypothetical protein